MTRTEAPADALAKLAKLVKHLRTLTPAEQVTFARDAWLRAKADGDCKAELFFGELFDRLRKATA